MTPGTSHKYTLVCKHKLYYYKNMKKDDKPSECCHDKMIFKNHHHSHGGSNAIYGLGVVGALFYFLQGASNLEMVIIGIGKAIFWPAILMFKLLTYLKM